jgi:hypothetical protein
VFSPILCLRKECGFESRQRLSLPIAQVALFPSVVRFFNEVTATVTGAGNLTIAVEDFWTDTGADATTLPALATHNSYFNGYVNCVLQMDDLLTYTPGGAGVGQLVITVPAGSTIEQNSYPRAIQLLSINPLKTSEE